MCVLAGHRAVVGDEVAWIEVAGQGGKLVGVGERRTVLVRTDLRAKEQVLAANLTGIVVVTTALRPPFREGLVDRYLVAAGVGGLQAVVALNKIDQGVPDEVTAALDLRGAVGIRILQVSAHTGRGLADLARVVATGTWCLVGHSGVGKTSIAAALIPDQSVGEIGSVSEHWGTGQHTTSGSRIFRTPGGGELVDAPGIRTFAPGRIAAGEVRDHFPGVSGVSCRYRDCLHREGESGCGATDAVDAALLGSYRRLLAEMEDLDARRRPGRRRSRDK